MNTHDMILEKGKQLFTQSGAEFSMRKLAQASGISPSVIYHYYKNKDELLRQAFDQTNTKLGTLRNSLPTKKSASEMLRNRIVFQFEHAHDIVFVLKYYMTYRKTFDKNKMGYIPEKGHLHIREVLEAGVQQKEFVLKNIDEDSKVIAHAINGFILEYYPDIPSGTERKKIVEMLHSFIVRALEFDPSKQ